MLTSRSIVAPRTSPARRPIVTNGAIIAPEWISTIPSIDDLAVDHVDAGMDDHRVADRDLRERHREPVRDARQERDAARLQARLQPVQRLPEVGVADQREPQHLRGGVGARAEFVALAAVARRDASVGDQRLAQRRMPRPQRAPEGFVVGHRRHPRGAAA